MSGTAYSCVITLNARRNLSQDESGPGAIAEHAAEYKLLIAVETEHQILLIAQKAGEQDAGSRRCGSGDSGGELRQRPSQNIGADQVIRRRRPDGRIVESAGAGKT